MAYCHRFDIQVQSSRIYFVACTIGRRSNCCPALLCLLSVPFWSPSPELPSSWGVAQVLLIQATCFQRQPAQPWALLPPLPPARDAWLAASAPRTGPCPFLRSLWRRPSNTLSVPAAYGLGLLVTFVALVLMQRGQPALLYLVPCTLLTSCTVALWRRELGAFWTGSGFAVNTSLL